MRICVAATSAIRSAWLRSKARGIDQRRFPLNGFTYQSDLLNFAETVQLAEIGATLETALDAILPTQATVSASITPQTTSFTASTDGVILKVTGVQEGSVKIGGYVCKTSNPCYGPYLPPRPRSPDFIGQVPGFLGGEPGAEGGAGDYTLFVRAPNGLVAVSNG